jgi:hypothetical protein
MIFYRLIAEIGSPATAEVAQRRTNIGYSGNTATISNDRGEKLILTKDALGRITSIVNQDANGEKISETTYAYSAENNTVTETKDSESSTIVAGVNWSDLAEKFGKQAILAALTAGQVGNLHNGNQFAFSALPVSMAFGAASFAAKKMGLNNLETAFDTVSSKAFELVVNNWNVANQGPLGKLFDKQVYGTTPLLRPLIGQPNQEFLAHWATGNSPAIIQYPSDSHQSREMQKSPNVTRAIDQFYAEGAPAKLLFRHDTIPAYIETIFNPMTANWHSTAMQVGGYRNATITNNGNGTMTIRIRNIAGANSFFLHLIPNLPGTSGPMHNIEQIFEWIIPIDPSRLPKNPSINNDLAPTKSVENGD